MSHKVLIAEDDDDVRALYRALLCDGCPERECVMAEDGQDAVEAYDAAAATGRPFDLLLLDVMMPRLNGFQVAQHVRFACRDDETGIVIVTGMPDNMTSMRAEYVHALEVWTKPIDPREFKRRIGYLLNRREEARAVACGEGVG